MFEIKTFGLTIFEKLSWTDLLIDFTEFKLRFSLIKYFFPRKCFSEETAQDIYFIYTVTNSSLFLDSTYDKPRL